MKHHIHDAAARGFEAAVEHYGAVVPRIQTTRSGTSSGQLGIAEGRDVLELGAGTGSSPS